MTELTIHDVEATFVVEESHVEVEAPVLELSIVNTGLELVIEETAQELSITDESPTLEVLNNQPAVEICDPHTTINQYFAAGSNSFSAIAGEALGGHRVVFVEDGEAFYADSSDVNVAGQVIGVTTGAANAGSGILIQFAGIMDESSWTFIPGPVYLGSSGILTQTRPSTGIVLNIGTAVTPTRLLIHRTATIEVI